MEFLTSSMSQFWLLWVFGEFTSKGKRFLSPIPLRINLKEKNYVRATTLKKTGKDAPPWNACVLGLSLSSASHSSFLLIQ